MESRHTVVENKTDVQFIKLIFQVANLILSRKNSNDTGTCFVNRKRCVSSLHVIKLMCIAHCLQVLSITYITI